MKLSEINACDKVRILSISDDFVKARALRLGIYEGSVLECKHKICGGPLILERHRQKTAVGYGIARNIEIVKV